MVSDDGPVGGGKNNDRQTPPAKVLLVGKVLIGGDKHFIEQDLYGCGC
jgi:hypothetical protein